MELVVFDTPAQQANGLQHLLEIPADTLYVFPLIQPGSYFHSRNVPEPFDIAFLAEDLTVLEIWTVTPPREGVDVPQDAVTVVEAKAGTLEKAGFEAGKKAQF